MYLILNMIKDPQIFKKHNPTIHSLRHNKTKQVEIYKKKKDRLYVDSIILSISPPQEI